MPKFNPATLHYTRKYFIYNFAWKLVAFLTQFRPLPRTHVSEDKVLMLSRSREISERPLHFGAAFDVGSGNHNLRSGWSWDWFSLLMCPYFQATAFYTCVRSFFHSRHSLSEHQEIFVLISLKFDIWIMKHRTLYSKGYCALIFDVFIGALWFENLNQHFSFTSSVSINLVSYILLQTKSLKHLSSQIVYYLHEYLTKVKATVIQFWLNSIYKLK